MIVAMSESTFQVLTLIGIAVILLLLLFGTYVRRP